MTTCNVNNKNNNASTNISGFKVTHKNVFGAHEIEIWYINADSLLNKLNELKALLQLKLIKLKVVAITEVKQKNNWKLSNSELQFDGYNLYTNDFI